MDNQEYKKLKNRIRHSIRRFGKIKPEILKDIDKLDFSKSQLNRFNTYIDGFNESISHGIKVLLVLK